MKTRLDFFLWSALRCASAAIVCLLLSSSYAARAQRLSQNVIPSHYSLQFTPDLKAATFAGSEAIDVSIKDPTNAITLNAIELKFESIEIDSRDGGTQSGSVSLDPEKQQATLTFREDHPRRRRDTEDPFHWNPQQRAARLLSFKDGEAELCGHAVRVY